MEEWKDVVGYEGLYQVSDNLRVRSLRQRDEEGDHRLLTISKYSGRDVVYLHRDYKSKRRIVKQLVKESFNGIISVCINQAPAKGLHDVLRDIILKLNLPDTETALKVFQAFQLIQEAGYSIRR